MQVKTHVKAGTGGTGGGLNLNHNGAQVRPVGLRIQTGVKAGITPRPCPPPEGRGPGGPNC
jgi:hypothetical protein